MGARKIKDLAVKVGSYTDQSGQTKGRYQNVGALMQGDDGNQYLILERWFNPAGVVNPDNRGNLLVSMFDVKPRDGQGSGDSHRQQSAQDQGPGRGHVEDDIPF